MKNIYNHIISIGFFILLFFVAQANGSEKNNSILHRLDLTIDSINFYNTKKENKITQHKQLILLEKDNKEKLFKIYGDLQSDYFKYNPDSCKKYTDLRIQTAKLLNNKSYEAESFIDLANWYIYVSMFSNAQKILCKIRKDLPSSLLIKYYSSLNSLFYLKVSYYGLFSEFRNNNIKQCYDYRDSISKLTDTNSYEYTLSIADKYRMEGNYKESIKYMETHLKDLDSNDSQIRLYANSLAQSYEKENKIEEAKYYYALSAISDIKNAIKETSSLCMLSSILFKEGDLNRANRYLQISLVNAIECKSRLRQIEAAEQMSVINKAYQDYIEKENRQYKTLIIILIIFFCIVGYLLYVSHYQKKQIKKSDIHLKDMNRSLERMNKNLIESNNIKTKYITQYINRCSKNIEDTESLFSSIIKTATYKDKDTLLKELRSKEFIKNQLMDFYNDFDKTFLNIYPDFIEKLNTYLKPEEKFELKVNNQLNTELRIFALIKLGIIDSKYMAKFLRCSLQTIYNYRSKNKSRVIDNNVNIEEKIQDINIIPPLFSNSYIIEHKTKNN